VLSSYLNVRNLTLANHLPDRPQVSPQVRRSIFDTEQTRTADRHDWHNGLFESFLDGHVSLPETRRIKIALISRRTALNWREASALRHRNTATLNLWGNRAASLGNMQDGSDVLPQ